MPAPRRAFSAVAPGTDLSRHARDLVRVHDAVMGGSRPPMRPRPVVARSWSRVMGLGLDPGGSNWREPLSVSQLQRRRRESALSLVIDELRLSLSAVAEASRFLMVVTDADGVILWREGSASVRLRADDLGFTEGAVWTEDHVGTNAIGTALAEAAPVQLFSAEHFEQGQHPWYCTAAPLHDPRTGDLLGVVDVSGPALTLHPAITALVETAVRLAESRLWGHHQLGLERLRRSAEHVLATTTGPLLLVDDQGWVAHHSGVAARDRVEAPDADRPLAVPGLGVCLPERLGDGWLVRPRPTGHVLDLHLDLTGAPVLEVRSEETPWRTPLSPRHAQILTLLHHAGPRGLSAAELSIALFGDHDHEVTVRAEISRMRRTLGALVATSPYRLSPGTALTVLEGG